MPYRFLEDIATADVAFRAWGADLEELFRASADATTNVMVSDLATIQPNERVPVSLTGLAPDLLLFDFLNDLIYLKDSRRLILRVVEIRIDETGGELQLEGTLAGETADVRRHPLVVDVKAITLHLFRVTKTDQGWEAIVVLDI